MTYELIIKANNKEELIALLEGAAFSDVSVKTEQQAVAAPTVTAPQAAPQVQPPLVSAPTVQPVAPQQVCTPAASMQREYTVEDLARAAAPLMDDPEGVRMLQELLASFNTVSLVDLDKSRFAEFAQSLRSLGVEV